jgi:hypothetical protein
MAEPTINEDLTHLVREFIAAAREKFQERIKDTDPDLLVERVFGGLAAIVAAALILLPWGRNRDGWIGALLGAAMRYLTKRTMPHGK